MYNLLTDSMIFCNAWTFSIFILMIPLSLIIGFFVVVWSIVMKHGNSKENRDQVNEEIRMVQEMYEGLEKMDKRITVLEELLPQSEKEETSNDK